MKLTHWTAIHALCSFAAAQRPSLNLTITPLLNSSTQAVTALDCTLTLNDTRFHAGQPLIALYLNRGATPTQRYDNASLTVTDDVGPLALTYTDNTDADVLRTWLSERDPVGVVHMQFRAVPRQVNETTASGPRVDLRADQGALIGLGTGFLPFPPADEDWNVRVRWEAPNAAPADMRYVSILGESLDISVVGFPSMVLEKAYYSVGPLQRWPARDDPSKCQSASGNATDREFAMFWTGSLPYDAARIGPTVQRHFEAVSRFFNDTTSPFRVFWRGVPRGYGGAGGFQGFLAEYDAFTAEELYDEALFNLLAHETIHSYALFRPLGERYDMWYREGVAVYYAVTALFLSGAVDRTYFVRWMNNNAQAYYTASTVALPWQTVVDKYWTGLDFVRTPYYRGFIYLAAVQGLIACETNGTRGLDDLVLELYRRFEAGEHVQTAEFVDVLASFVGRDKAQSSFDSMANGTLIVPDADGLAQFGLRLIRSDAPLLDMGFDLARSGKQVVGLKAGSHAEAAGLREGDTIVRLWSLWGAGDSLNNQMRVVVLRDGQEVFVDYLPRSTETLVESYKWVDA